MANLFYVNQIIFYIMKRILKEEESAKVIVVLNPKHDRYNDPVDVCDYKHPAIIALIPVIQKKDGTFVEPLSGKKIQVPENNSKVQIRTLLTGHEFRYPDSGRVILFGKNRQEYYFADKYDEAGREVLRGFSCDDVKYLPVTEEEKK